MSLHNLVKLRDVILLALGVFILSGFNPVFADRQITYLGCYQGVEPPKLVTFTEVERISLFAVMQQAPKHECVYYFGASLQQPRLINEQQKQKNDLLKALVELLNRAIKQGESEIGSDLESLIAQVKAQPVTGRLLDIDLDLTRIETQALKNRLITTTSFVYLPTRKQPIRLFGLAKKTLPFDAQVTIQELYESLTLPKFVESGWIWALQTNGKVKKVKVGYWAHQQDYIAPGGWLMPVIADAWAQSSMGDINDLLIGWLKTQTLQPMNNAQEKTGQPNVD